MVGLEEELKMDGIYLILLRSLYENFLKQLENNFENKLIVKLLWIS